MHYTQGVKCATSALKRATGTPNATGETRKMGERITPSMSRSMRFEAPKVSNLGPQPSLVLPFPSVSPVSHGYPLEPIQALEEIEHFGYAAAREGPMPT